MNNRRVIPFLFLLGAVLRLAMILYPPYAIDILNFEVTGYFALQGWNIYQLQPFYNYSPILAHICAFLFNISNHLLYVGAHRAFLALVDIGAALLIYRLTRDRFTTAVYWLVGALQLYGGQFDSFALLPLLGAVAFPPLTFVLSTAGVLVKQSVLPFVWVLFAHQFGAKRGLWRMVALGALFALSFAPYLPAGAEAIWQNVIRYSSTMSGGGNVGMTLLLYGGLILLPIALRQYPLRERLFMQSLWLSLLIPHLLGQYLAYPLLFAALTRRWRWCIGLGIALALINIAPLPEQWVLIGLPVRTAAALTLLSWVKIPIWNRRPLPA